MTDQPITIVLPMHNAESLIHRSVCEVLELAHTFAGDFSVVIVDNGSTDETYESACELAAVYPQVSVLRQSVQHGLKRVMELVRQNCHIDAVVVHDGVTPIDVDQLRSILLASDATNPREQENSSHRESSASGSRRFGALRQLQANMESAHASISGFCWMRLETPLPPRRHAEATSTTVVTAMPYLPITTVLAPSTSS